MMGFFVIVVKTHYLYRPSCLQIFKKSGNNFLSLFQIFTNEDFNGFKFIVLKYGNSNSPDSFVSENGYLCNLS